MPWSRHSGSHSSICDLGRVFLSNTPIVRNTTCGRIHVFTLRTLLADIVADREAHVFVLNALAVGERDSARGLDSLAELICDSVIKQRVRRHHAEEMRHYELFSARLRQFGLSPIGIAHEFDYVGQLQACGWGLPPDRAKSGLPLT